MSLAIPLDEILAAKERIKSEVLRMPLVKLNVGPLYNVHGKEVTIYLKYENLQPVNSFKLRAAANILTIQKEKGNLDKGVWTASAGNMAAGVAWMAKEFKVPCTVVVPDHAPEAKLSAITRIYPDTKIVKVPWEKWWNILKTHTFEDQANYNWDFGFFRSSRL